MAGQEEGLPERVRHPGRERARDQEAAGDVEPDGGPIHREIVADRSEPSVGGHPLPSEPPSMTDMSISAWPSMRPATPLPAWILAFSRRSWVRNVRKRTTKRTTISGAPTNSASVNCQRSRANMMMLSSKTRLVEAISNAMAAMKCAPLRKIE